MRHYLSALLALLVLLVGVAVSNHKKPAVKSYQDECHLYVQNVNITTDGGECNGNINALFCYGRCQSTAYPKFYTAR